MKYRENSESESHVVNSLEANITASISLSRVFTSSEFKSILHSIAPSNRARFFAELISGIELRIPESPLMHFVKILATEECCRVWEYQESLATLALASSYDGLGSEFSSKLLSGLAGQEHTKPTSEFEKALSEISCNKSLLLTSTSAQSRSTLWSLVSHLPLTIRIKLFRGYVRLYAIKQPSHYWNAYWK
jgi:hypothetical protein